MYLTPTCEECGERLATITRIIKECRSLREAEGYAAVYTLCEKCELIPELWEQWPIPNISLVI